MENFVGLLYNSGTTQQGLAYKNGFGSVYSISGANAPDRCMIKLVSPSVDKILENEGFIFWVRFNILKIGNTNKGYFFTTDSPTYIGPSASAFTVGFDANPPQAPYMGFSLGVGGTTIPYRNLIPGAYESDIRIVPSSATTGISSFNLLIYKDPNKNFTDASGFTTYMNNFKKVHPAFTYGLPYFDFNTAKFCFLGGFSAPESMGMDMNIHNFGMTRTTMTPAEFDLFAQKMFKYDNYWHLFENETDTPNINQSQIIFYMPFYQKFGGNSSLSTINLMYPKSTTKYVVSSSDNTSWLNMTLGNKNRWRKPYPPYEPYI
jgi:hypothetical protein